MLWVPSVTAAGNRECCLPKQEITHSDLTTKNIIFKKEEQASSTSQLPLLDSEKEAEGFINNWQTSADKLFEVLLGT